MQNTSTKITESIARLPQVRSLTGLSKTTLYARIREGSFPAPISLGGSSVGWLASEVSAWIEQQKSAPRRLGPKTGSTTDATPASASVPSQEKDSR